MTKNKKTSFVSSEKPNQIKDTHFVVDKGTYIEKSLIKKPKTKLSKNNLKFYKQEIHALRGAILHLEKEKRELVDNLDKTTSWLVFAVFAILTLLIVLAFISTTLFY